MVGFPSGLNEQQWLRNMQAEHEEVDPGAAGSNIWGASDRLWTTGNYNLTTAPSKEWAFAHSLSWEGKRVDESAGGYEKNDDGSARDKSDCHFRKIATEYDRKSDINWFSCTAK
jgi:hypothetical protein